MYENHLEIQQHEKVEDENDDSNLDNQEQVLCYYDFWNQAPDDLLTEIFIRHPDSRSALRTTTVCRRWRSLISRNHHFIERFKSHHRRHHHRYPPESLPWAIMLRKSRDFQTLCQLHSDEWVFLHGKFPDNSFDFLPSSPFTMIIKASCNDLFLVSPTSRFADDHYVCNPITKQFVHLPSIPRLGDQVIYGGMIKYALLRTQSGPTADDMQFKVVVVLQYPSLDLNIEPKKILPVVLYRSESREWETRSFPCLELGNNLYQYDNNDRFYPMDIITCNGVLYWLGTSDNREMVVVYLDLSKEKSGVIHIPSSSSPGDIFICAHRIGIVHASGGLQELRLLQVDTCVYRATFFLLKVWVLKDYDDRRKDLSLVHDVELVWPGNSGQGFTLSLSGAFFHPTNGDLVFTVFGKNVIEYDLGNGMNKKVGELGKIVSWPLMPFLMVGA